MKNRFNLNESEKNHIKGLHGISEQGLMGNIFNTRDGGHTISKDRIITILKQIKNLQDEDAPAIAQRRLEELFDKVGITSGESEVEDVVDVEVEDDGDTEEGITESKQPIEEQHIPKSVWHMDEKNDLMSKVDDIHRILTTPSKAWNK